MNTRYIEGWNAGLEAAAKEFDTTADVWVLSARKRNHDDPMKAGELSQAAWFRNTAFHLRGLKLHEAKT